jgi:hypothetical protein
MCVVLSLSEHSPMVFRFLRQTGVFIRYTNLEGIYCLQLVDILSLIGRN